MATWGHDRCKKTPDGEHIPEISEIEVERHGKKEIMVAIVCRYCGAQLVKPKRKKR